jgi:hypothetical protein
MGDDETSIEFTFLPSDGSPQFKTQTKGNQITYKNIEKDTNLIYTVQDDGKTVKEDIELTQKPSVIAEDSKAISDLSYTFEINLQGLTYTKQPDGSFSPIFTDERTGRTYSIPELVMTDAKGVESRDLNMYIFQEDAYDPNILRAILTPDNDWLMADDRQYPVKIDPTVTWAQANWWNDAWLYRKSAVVTNSTGSTLTNHQVKVTLDTQTLITAGKINANCTDIRVILADVKEAVFWIEES